MNAPVKLYVKNIVEDLYNSTIGIETDVRRIVVNLILILDMPDVSLILKSVDMSQGEGIFFLHNYKQFIVRAQLGVDRKNWTMVIYDFKNNIDNVLDAYNDLTKHEWEKMTKDDFMKQFLEIEKRYNQIEFAELTLEDLQE